MLALHLLGGLNFDPPGSTQLVVFVVRMWSCQGASEVSAGVECSLAQLRSRGQSGFVRWMRWGQFFWLVRRRGGNWRDLLTDFERRHAAGVLVLALMLDVMHGGAGGCVNERGDVGATVIEGVGVSVDGVVVTAVAGVEGVGGVGNDDAGIGNAAAVVVVAVGDVGIVGAVAAAVIGDSVGNGIVVKCIGIAVHRVRGQRGVSKVGGDGAYVVAVVLGIGVGIDSVGIDRAGSVDV